MTETMEQMLRRHAEELGKLIEQDTKMAIDARILAPLQRHRDLDLVAERVGAVAGFSTKDLRGPRRKQPLAYARQVAMWEMRRLGYSYTVIGRYFDRDHTTVMHSVEVVERRLSAAEVAA